MNFLLILGIVLFVVFGLRSPQASRSNGKPFNRP